MPGSRPGMTTVGVSNLTLLTYHTTMVRCTPDPSSIELDLARDSAPDVVPVELRLGLDVLVVDFLRVLRRDDHAGAVELPMLLGFLGGIEHARLGRVADRQAHAALPERIPGDRAGHLALLDRLDGE